MSLHDPGGKTSQKGASGGKYQPDTPPLLPRVISGNSIGDASIKSLFCIKLHGVTGFNTFMTG